jgi:hypothetical protein
MNRGSICASHARPSGSYGFSMIPTRKRLVIAPAASARMSTPFPPNHPPSLILK